MLVNGAIFFSTYFYIFRHLNLVLTSSQCNFGPHCAQGSVCFQNKCEDFNLNASYVRVADTKDKTSHILQFRLGRGWFSVVEMHGIQQPSRFCRVMNIEPDRPYYLQRKTTVVDEEGCVLVKNLDCQTACIGKVQNLQTCSEKYRLSLICNSDYRTSAVFVNGYIDHAFLNGKVEALHNNQWLQVCSRERQGVAFIQRIIGDLCQRNKYNKLVISDTCAAEAQTAAIYKYYEYVYSIHEEKCRIVLQTKCIKEKQTSDALQVINNINSSILRCDIGRSPRVQPFPENVTYYEPTTFSGKGNPNNEENRDNYCNIHGYGTTPIGVIHTSYGVILSVLVFSLGFTVFKICKMRSELQKLQDFKLSKQPNVRFVKPAKVSLKFTKKNEIRVISATNMETDKPEGNDGIESAVIYALPNKSTQRCSDDVHEYACTEFDNMPNQNSLDSKIKETRGQYDEINTYEDLSSSRVVENMYQGIYFAGKLD